MKNKAYRPALAVMLLLVLAIAGLAGPTVSADGPPDITISVNTTWAAGTYTYGTVRVTNNAKLTLQSDTAASGFQGVQINAVNLTVDAGASISADGQGWASTLGPGQGSSNGNRLAAAGGASHGGEGGNGDWDYDGAGGTVIYGDASAPLDLGSGGGAAGYSGIAGGGGGGAIRLNLTGTATINGVVSANGGTGASNTVCASGGGSGGSVWLTASQLAGSGTIRANGGNGGGNGGGGSGGRVAVEYTGGTFTGNTLVIGGNAASAAGDGEDGTVMFNGTLSGLADSGNPSTTVNVNTHHFPAIGLTYNFSNLVIQSGGIIELKANRSNSMNAGTIAVNSGGTISGATGSTLDISSSGTIAVNSGGTISGATGSTLNISSSGATTIGGVVKAPRVSVQAISLDVQATGNLNADGLGWASGLGPGKGSSIANSYAAGGGASHAGEGGNGDWTYDGAGSAIVYGDVNAPEDLGSGGGTGYSVAGGAGGGAIRLNLTGMATINGVVSANGGAGSSTTYGAGGGGSGGSVWLTATQLTGSGTFRANGGAGGSGGGGAGGRVAVQYTSGTFTGNTLVIGGNATQDGEDGTVMFNGTLSGLADSGNPSTTVYVTTKHYPAIGLTYSSPNLVIQSGGIIELKANRSDIINAGTLTINGTGKVTGAAGSTLTLSGSSITMTSGTVTGPRVVVLTANLTVDAGASISADGLGWASYSGPGKGGSASSQVSAGGGASHAGEGGKGVWNNSGAGSTVIYGDASAPVDLGSGGGPAYAGAVGGAGGGAIRLNVTGTATINGVVSANGGTGARSSDWYGAGGGGSGGSVWLTASQLAGSGTIRANGGDGASGAYWPTPAGPEWGYAGGGSGGRVAVEYASTTFTGNTLVIGGNSIEDGEDGTVMFNGTLSGLADSGNPWTTVNVTSKHSLASGLTYNFSNLVMQSGGSLELKANRSNGINAVTSTLRNINGAAGTTLNLSGGAITIPDGTVKATRVSVQANTLDLQSAANLNADGLGWASGLGPGKGSYATNAAGGASYAGEGGNGIRGGSIGAAGTVIYGSASTPEDPGSGGGAAGYGAAGGAGGGAIRLNLTGTATINGVVSANGGSGTTSSNNYGASGGGSGGSVWLTASQLAGSGTIRANGGGGGWGVYWPAGGDPEWWDGGGGSGGRVALEFTSAPFTGNTLVIGSGGGEDGTVMFNGTLSGLANSGNPWTTAIVTTKHYLASGLTYNFSNLVMQSGGSLEIKANRSNGINAATSTLRNINGAAGSTLNVSGGAITIPDGTVKASRVSVQANTLDLQSAANLNADSLGWASGLGSGKGSSIANSYGAGGGASHAGEGGSGDWNYDGAGSAIIYGDVNAPIDLGSGGGSGGGVAGGPGGGAIRLNLTGTATINGTVSANGGNGATTSSGVGGGGSGGSVWLTAPQIAGSGTFRANGGAGGSGGGGAGGRVAVQFGSGTFTGNTLVIGGNATQDGEDGTVMYNGTLSGLADSGNPSTTVYVTSKHYLVRDLTYNFSNLVIQNYGDLELKANRSNSINAGAITVNSGGTISGAAGTTLNISVTGAAIVGGVVKATRVSVQSVSMDVQATGNLNADSLGWASGLGPGKGSSIASSYAAGGGASHAGEGGNGDWTYDGAGSTIIYGDVNAPVDPGSGGGSAYSNSAGGAGGGVIRLSLTGTATINGMVSANGGAGASTTNSAAGGGSGGSVWLTASQLAGSGTIRANGGNGGTGGGGGGSGGRVAVQYGSGTFTGNTLVIGGNATQDGEDGTVMFNGTLSGLADSGNPSTTVNVNTHHFPAIGLTYSANRLVVQSGGNIEIKAKRSNGVFAGELVIETGGAVNLASGDSTTSTAVTLTGITSGTVRNVQGAAWTAVTLSGGAFTIPDGTVKAARVNVQAASLTVNPTASISADGTGWPSALGPGKGSSIASSYAAGGGASHAGEGGNGDWMYDGAGSTVIYGNGSAPVDLGSGGGTGYAVAGGAGGGAIRVSLTGTATINGTVSANGLAGSSTSSGAGGGGSGGSVWVSTWQLSGTGTIRANGGDGGSGGGGSGGRLAVEYSSAPFTGNTLVIGGNGSVSSRDGEDGTVMFNGTLSSLADSGNPWTTANVTTHHFPAGGITSNFSNLVIQSGGNVELKANRSNGVNATGFTINPGGTVSMGAKSTLTVMADTVSASGLISLASGDSTTSTTLSLYGGASTLKNIQGALWSTVNLSGGAVTIPAAGAVKATRISVQAGSLDVQATGTLNADLLGWPSYSGAGKGSSLSNQYSAGGGASYGGKGGNGDWNFDGSGSTVTYGNANAPVDLGSGGGTGYSVAGGAGGGAIRVNVTGTATINGTVSANGGTGSSSSSGLGGGGSGGSVWLTASQLAGASAISANGGCGGVYSSYKGGGGSGGRVAVEYGSSSFSGTRLATNSGCNGENGTSNTPPPKTMPVITWSVPSDITYGTALGGGQLGATSSVPGTFTYTLTAGTILGAGNRQNLHVEFTPTDTTNYSSSYKDVTINVVKATPAFSGLASATIAYGASPTTLGGTITYGSLVPSGSVLITVGGLTQSAAIDPATGSFSSSFPTGTLGAGIYAITYQYSGDMNFNNYNSIIDSSKAITVTGGTTAFDALSSPLVPHGTGSTVLSGRITNGALFPTGSVEITLNGVTQFASINPATGAFSSGFSISNLWAGTYLITYFYRGDDTANSLTDNARTLTVSKTTPAFSGLSSPVIIVGATPTALAGTIKDGSLVPTGSVSITLNGVTQSAAIDAGTGSFSSSFASAALGKGSYAITYQYGGDPVFNGVTDASKVFQVNGLTPAFSNLSSPAITYGDTPTTLSGSITFGSQVPTGNVSITLNGVTQTAAIASVTGNFSSSFVTGTLGGGSRVVTYQYGGDSTFNGITDSSKTFTVNRATLTVTANDASRAYAASNPAFSAGYSGFKNGETLAGSGVTGSPGLTTAAVPASPVSGSPYTITADTGTLASGNYAFAFVSGSLTVSMATPAITWANPANIAYGTALSGVQLNAIAAAPGSFVYTPAAGTVLNAGNSQNLHVEFTPTDPANYNSASKDVTINVVKATPVFSGLDSPTILAGDTPTTVSGTITYGTQAPPGSVFITLNGVTQFASIDAGTGSFSSDFATGALGAGGYTIACQYVGNANLNSVSDSSRTLTVTGGTTAFSNLSSPVIVYGVTPVTLGGTISDGLLIPAGSVSITLNGVTQPAPIDVGTGAFSSSFATGALWAGSYAITYSYESDGVSSGLTDSTRTLTVNKATPVITWANPADIAYGAALSGTQLNALASVPGGFVYTPAAGTVLNAGNNQNLHVEFTPADTANFNSSADDVKINVVKATPAFSNLSAPAITYGDTPTTLSGSITFGSQVPTGNVSITLNGVTQTAAIAAVTGNFSSSFVTGTLGGGSRAISYQYGGDSTFNGITDSSKTFTVNRATLTVTANDASRAFAASNPAFSAGYSGFKNGETLAGSGVTGSPGLSTAAVPASPVSGSPYTIIADTGSLASGNYAFTFVSGSLTVSMATPAITWANPANIAYGTELGGVQLNAIAAAPGSFVYTPAAGTVLNAGNSQNLHVEFTPDDADNYNGASGNVKVNVIKAIPEITWANPADIAYGTALSSTQLNAIASVPGSFFYAPAAGTVLSVGNNHNLHLDFIPDDEGSYSITSVDVKISVVRATPVITWANPADIAYGTVLGGAQLNAVASVPGSFVYTPAVGTLLTVGDNRDLHVTFTPADAASYNGAAGDVTINVLKATPDFSNLSSPVITYGVTPTTLSGSITFGSQVPTGNVSITLNGVTQTAAIGPVTGNFSFDFATGALGAGSYAITYQYGGDANFNGLTDTSNTITVNMAATNITWANPADITYGTALGGAQLNAIASVPGSFVYSPAAGTLLSAGNVQNLHAVFTPTDATNYSSATKDVKINVLKAMPVITWASPADIVYGTVLGAAQLNASASVSGSFVYTSAAGTVPGAGNVQNLHADFTPTDTTNYSSASSDVTMNVLKATPTIAWASPADIVYGTALGGAQLNAVASVPGSFVYTPAAGTLLGVGNNQGLHAAFTPIDTTNYNGAAKDVQINVLKATPVITWASPADIVYGTALGDTQLNAIASVPGGFVYTPAAGIVLSAGNNRNLHVAFTPTDAASYNGAVGDVTINVSKATPAITWANPADIVYGIALGGAQLNAGASVAGSFVYAPAAGVVLNAGNNRDLHAAFTPADTANYNSASSDVKINVLKATPIITWANPANIASGTALSVTQLNAFASVPGSFLYTPPAGTLLGVGNNQDLHVELTPTDTANYSSASSDVKVNVRAFHGIDEAWVDDNYDSLTPGWQIDHFNNISEAIGNCNNGAIVHVYPGTYVENINVDRPVLIRSTNGAVPTIIRPANPGMPAITLGGTHDITIDGFTITGATASHGILVGGGAGSKQILNNTITGNTGTDSGVYFEGSTGAGTRLRYNEITGNGTGVRNAAGVSAVDARFNYWGSDTGPAHYSNPLGSGDRVSGGVTFQPWLTKLKDTAAGVDEIDARAGAETKVIKRGAGTPRVVVGRYSQTPGGPPDFIVVGAYFFDVFITTAAGVDEIEIRHYYTDEEVSKLVEQTLKLMWWDDSGSRWRTCSVTGVNMEENYIWAKVRPDTSPTLAQLTGTPFSGSGERVVISATSLWGTIALVVLFLASMWWRRHERGTRPGHCAE